MSEPAPAMCMIYTALNSSRRGSSNNTSTTFLVLVVSKLKVFDRLTERLCKVSQHLLVKPKIPEFEYFRTVKIHGNGQEVYWVLKNDI